MLDEPKAALDKRLREHIQGWVASFLGDTNLIPCTVLERRGSEAAVDLGGLETDQAQLLVLES